MPTSMALSTPWTSALPTRRVQHGWSSMLSRLSKDWLTSLRKRVLRGDTLKTWRAGSLFRFIDDALVVGRGDPVFGLPFPALVCDDLATEVGDFIGVDSNLSNPRVVFVVAKHKSGKPGVSASAFYDVSGQALKNLAYLKSDGQEVPGSPTKFDQNWTLTEAGKTDKVPRRRAGPGSVAFRKL